MEGIAKERSQRFNPRPADGWFLPVNEIADVLRVSSMTVYRLIEQGELAAVRVGKFWRIAEGELARYLERAEKGGAA
jgi:excisionase family DNA binding protein